MNKIESDADSLRDAQSDRLNRWKWPLGVFLTITLAVGIPFAWSRWELYCTSQYEQACKNAMKAQDWMLLEQIAANWSVDSPESGSPWLYRAEAALHEQRFEAANDYFSRVPESDPRCAAVRMQQIDLQFGVLNDPLMAEQTCLDLIAFEPRVTDAHQRLIFFYAMTYQRQKLVDAIKTAISASREPAEAFVYLLGRNWLVFSNGFELNKKWLEQYPDEAVFHLGMALSLPDADNVAEGLPGRKALMREYQNRFPEELEVVCFMIEEAISAGDARALASRLGSLPPEFLKDSRTWRYKGWYEQNQNQTHEAISSYVQSLKLNAVDWLSQHQLSELYRITGEAELAEKYAKLGAEGKALSRTVMELPSVRSVDVVLIRRVEAYFRDSGDTQTADAIQSRIR